MIRSILLIAITISAIFTSPFFVWPFAIWYSFRYFAPELIFAAALLDAYFGTVSSFPYYTLASFITIIVTMFIKRYIMI